MRRSIRIQARAELESALYAYRRLFNLPRHDPRADLPDIELLLELELHRLWELRRSGKQIDEVLYDADPATEEAIERIIAEDSEEAWEAWEAEQVLAAQESRSRHAERG